MTTTQQAELQSRADAATVDVGKAYFAFAANRVQSYGQVYLRHPSDSEWAVLAVWPVSEGFDDDSGSWNCGCPLEHSPHAHQQFGPTGDRSEATEVWARWTLRLLDHQAPAEEG